MPTTIHHVRLPGGITIECAEQGRRGGPALLMLHGITDTWRSFEPVLPLLPADWHVISMTQRGHGGSSVAASYRTRDFAADAASLIATLGLKQVLVVGHSMGAVNALRMAIDQPARVRGVVAAGAFASFSDKPDFVDFVRSQIMTLGERVPRALAESFQRDTVAGPVAPGLMDTMVEECLRTPAATWRGAFAALLEDDFSAELHAVEVPVLLPWGEADAFSPESDQQRLERQLPRATRAVYAGVGHALHWEQPRRFAADLLRFEEMLAMTS
ncbi:alpha/beta hydrolase [Ramlibacter solisilvae]|uniref:alpha/beta fold hydrolase n=1 Tax=Ramlibacter tataouinensis TaxID=94132 RepID=UPI000777A252|nr:alpha/beta hydrolase [Ramlibacter tataouinensis]